MKPDDRHTEIIHCPECGKVQTATVLHTIPWWIYVHECIKCAYLIGESEWIKLDEPT